MNLIIKGKNIDVTDNLRDYIEKKFCKLEKYNQNILEIEVECAVDKNPRIANNSIVEAVIYTKGNTIRATEAQNDMYSAVDMIIEKLEKQIKKQKVKKFDKIDKVKTSVALSKENKEEEE